MARTSVIAAWPEKPEAVSGVGSGVPEAPQAISPAMARHRISATSLAIGSSRCVDVNHDPPGASNAGAEAMSRIPRAVWMLGLVSLCMDASSELIHSLLPVFLVGTLGASPALLGLIEGVGEG